MRSNDLIALTASAATALVLAGCDASIRGSDSPSATLPSLVVSNSGSASFTSGVCQSGFKVTQQASGGGAEVAAAAVAVKLNGGGSGIFYTDTACADPAPNNTITIPAGASSATFSFKDSSVEPLSITASANGATSGSAATATVQGILSVSTPPTGDFACAPLGNSNAQHVLIKTAGGSTATNATDSVTLTAYTDNQCQTAATGTLTGNTATAVAGDAKFASFQYKVNAGVALPVSIYLKATSSTAATSVCQTTPITLATSGAYKLGFSAIATAATAGTNFSPAPSVQLQDACGNAVTTGSAASDSVALAVFSDSSCTLPALGGTFSGNAATPLASGVASFSAVQYTKAGTFYVQAADTKASTPILPGCSAAVTVGPGTPVNLAMITTTSPNQSTCSPAFTAGAVDTYGNFSPVTQNTTMTMGGLASATLYTNPTCTTPVTGPYALTSSITSETFYVKDANSESIPLTATASGGMALTAGSLQVFTGTGTTVQDYALVAGQACEFNGLNHDNSGNVIALADCTGSDGDDHWLVRRSTDGGATWTNIDDFVMSPGNEFNVPDAFGEDSAGNMYVTGYADPGNQTQAWITRKLAAGSSTWTTIDNYEYANGTTSATGCLSNQPYCNGGTGIAFDASNNVYVAGFGTDNDTVSGASPNEQVEYSIVRKLPANTSNPTATSWTIVDTYAGENTPSAPYASAAYNPIAIDGSNIYVTGSYADGTSGDMEWFTRKSVNAGATWTTIDQYEYVVGESAAQPQGGIAIDTTNHYIYTAGVASDSNGSHHWIVRKSTTGLASSFGVVDDYNYNCTANCGTSSQNGGPSVASAIAVDGSGNIYVAGYEALGSIPGTSTNTKIHAPVRKSIDHGTNWTLVDDWFYSMDLTSYTRAFAGLYTGGHFYWSGAGKGLSSQVHALIRKY